MAPLHLAAAGDSAARHARADELARSSGNFPLPVAVHNEIGDLIEAFNRMVASIEEQRSGLNDTLSLLDSMLANAPIGLAFFDRRCRFVRVNQVFAEMTGVPLSRHLGRTLPELAAAAGGAGARRHGAARLCRRGAGAQPGVERAGTAHRSAPWTWLASAYPVRTSPQPGALGGRDCARRQRPQAQRRGPAQDREAGRDRPPGRFYRARDQQSARGDYQPALPAAQLLPARGAGVELRGDGRARGAAHRRDHAADAALLSPIHAAGARQHGRAARLGAHALPRPAEHAEHPGGARLRRDAWTSSALPARCARCSPTWWATRSTPLRTAAG